MPARSTVDLLPPEIKTWLDKALVDRAFGNYEALVAALIEKGFTISKSALHRYGSKLEETLADMRQATECARQIADTCPDDPGLMNDVMIRLMQEKLFKLLMDMRETGEISLAEIGHVIANLARASVTAKKYAAEIRAKITEKFDKIEADAAGGKRKIDADTLRQVREEIYGLVG